MSEWKEFNLADIYDFSSGLSKPRKEFGFGYDFLSFKDVFDNYFLPGKLSSLVNSNEKERERCSIKKGDVFLTRTSETDDDLGMSSVALKDYPSATFNGFTKRLRPKAANIVMPEFAGFYFRSTYFRAIVTSMASITTRASLNNQMLGAINIKLPPLPEQKAIAAVLSSLDDKIDLLHRQNKTLEALAETLFRQWFIEESKGDWEVIELSEIIDLRGGFVHNTKATGDTVCKIAKMGVVNGKDFFNRNSVINYSEEIPEKFKLTEDDLIICTRDVTQDRIVIGNVAIVPKDLADFGIYAGSNTWTVKTKFDIYFLFLLFRSQDFRNHIIQSSKGSTIVMITRDAFLSKKINIPPNKTLYQNMDQINPFIKKIKINSMQIQLLEKLRDTLLPKLMSGEVNLRMKNKDYEN